MFYRTRYASAQGALIPFNPQESLALYRPPFRRLPRPQASPMQQLLPCEWIPTA